LQEEAWRNPLVSSIFNFPKDIPKRENISQKLDDPDPLMVPKLNIQTLYKKYF